MTDEDLSKTFSLQGDDEGILYLEILDTVNDVGSNVEQAELIAKKFQKIFEEHKQKEFKAIIDLTKISASAHYPSPRARSMFSEMANHHQLKKLAVIAPSMLSRAIMSFVIKPSPSSEKEINFFKNKSEALEWLKQENEE
jgi:stage II sporulation SpoAA-like protein